MLFNIKKILKFTKVVFLNLFSGLVVVYKKLIVVVFEIIFENKVVFIKIIIFLLKKIMFLVKNQRFYERKE